VDLVVILMHKFNTMSNESVTVAGVVDSVHGTQTERNLCIHVLNSVQFTTNQLCSLGKCTHDEYD